MNDSDDNGLIAWYRQHVRPFFTRTDPGRVGDYDADATRLADLARRGESEMPVCFLGNSGIGKSTLINALAAGAQMILPSGGIGPLTAQALTVCYGEEASFEVLYHPPQALNRVIFGLDRHCISLLRRAGENAAPVSPAALGLALDEKQMAELSDLEDEEAPDRESRIEHLKKQALLMVAGSQDAERDLAYLIDALRIAYGLKPVRGHAVREEDQERVTAISKALQFGKKQLGQHFREAQSGEFQRQLHEHATGFLAPLIKDLKLRWNSPLLAGGLTLIDLPGVGIAGDIYSGVTEAFIREKAQAIVLVVSSRGVPEKEAELLRNSGFLNRLLHASDDPASDPVELIVVVVRTDDLSRVRSAQDKSKRRVEHFADVCEESAARIRSQLRGELEKVWTTSEGLTVGKKEVLDGLMDRMQVHALSAVQYQLFLAEDEEEPAFVKTPEQSGVPQLITALQQIAERRQGELRGKLARGETLFLARLNSRLEVSRTQWIEQSGADEEAEALRVALGEFLAPLQKEFNVRQGMFREFLKATLPVLIGGMVQTASGRARQEIVAFMRGLEGAHWKTLQAAVRHGGTYCGARLIRLPHDFALRFEEPIAEVWGKQLLSEIRKRTREYAEDCVRLVEQVLEWAKEQEDPVNTARLEAQIKVIKGDAERLNVVGAEAVDELREIIKNSLVTRVEPPIRERCERFVATNYDRGRGVRRRILDLFSELADETVEAATEPALELLTERFREVEREILGIFDEHQENKDPLGAAAGAVSASHEEWLRHSDSAKRVEVLAQIDVIEAARPKAL